MFSFLLLILLVLALSLHACTVTLPIFLLAELILTNLPFPFLVIFPLLLSIYWIQALLPHARLVNLSLFLLVCTLFSVLLPIVKIGQNPITCVTLVILLLSLLSFLLTCNSMRVQIGKIATCSTTHFTHIIAGFWWAWFLYMHLVIMFNFPQLSGSCFLKVCHLAL